jgi:hypothetical protein
MTNHNLRYFALGAYTALSGLMIFLDKIELDPVSAAAILGPIAIVLGADVVKHRNETK